MNSMIYFVFIFLTFVDAGETDAIVTPPQLAPLFGVCAIHARYFAGVAYQPDVPFWNVMSTEMQGVSLEADFEALRNSDFIELYLSQEEYCQQSEVSTLASQVADGTHEKSVEIWNSCVFELLEASVLFSLSTAGRRNLGFFESLGKGIENLGTSITGIDADDRNTQESNPLRNVAVPPIQLGMPNHNAVGHTINDVVHEVMTGEIEVATPQTFANTWMHTWGYYGVMIFALLIVAAVIGALVNEFFRKHGRRKLESSSPSTSLNGLSIDMGSIAESCHLHTGSFICDQPLHSISEMMQAAICGGAANKMACVLDVSQLHDFVHFGMQQGRRMLASGTEPVADIIMSSASTGLDQTDSFLNASFIGMDKFALVLVFCAVAMFLTHRIMPTKQRGFDNMEQVV